MWLCPLRCGATWPSTAFVRIEADSQGARGPLPCDGMRDELSQACREKWPERWTWRRSLRGSGPCIRAGAKDPRPERCACPLLWRCEPLKATREFPSGRRSHTMSGSSSTPARKPWRWLLVLAATVLLGGILLGLMLVPWESYVLGRVL